MRIRRGLNRAGIVVGSVLAALALVIGAVAFFGEFNRQNSPEFEKFACLLRENGSPLDGEVFRQATTKSRCGYFPTYNQYEGLIWIVPGQSINHNGYVLSAITPAERRENAERAAIYGVVAAAGAFVFGYGIFYVLGWVLAGFKQGDEPATH